jgi:hypothetical protein
MLRMGRSLPEMGLDFFSQKTGQWVRDGSTFYLQNVSMGLPLNSENTIAAVTVRQQSEG